MPWKYTLRAEQRVPPCPRCGSRLGVVRLKQDIFVCLDHLPREAWEARWEAEAPISIAERKAV